MPENSWNKTFLQQFVDVKALPVFSISTESFIIISVTKGPIMVRVTKANFKQVTFSILFNILYESKEKNWHFCCFTSSEQVLNDVNSEVLKKKIGAVPCSL